MASPSTVLCMELDDEVVVRSPAGERSYWITAIDYPLL